MLVEAGLGRPPDDELRRLIDADDHPDVLALEDALGATLLDERYVAELPGLRGRFLRRLPLTLAQVVEAHGRRHEVDALVTWGERLAYPLSLLLLVTRSRTPHVAILFWVSKPKKAVPLRVLHRGITRILLPDACQRGYARRRLPIPPERMPDLRWGTDVRFWRPLAGRTDTISCVGREMRDYPTVVEAVRGSGVPCHIAAGTIRHMGNPWLARLEQGEALPAEVTVGRRSFPELRALYARSRFVVVPLLPSDNGNGHTSICEALAMGRPVICSDIEGLRGVFDDLPFVRLVPPGDAEALREALLEWWADPARCDRLGREGRAWVERHYPLGQWVAAVRAEVGRAVSQRRPVRVAPA
jgi:glycosyltransferase involved in cell wall biosynthesis